MPLEKDIRERLSKTFKVPEERCDEYYKVYNETLLPLIQGKFLAHLVSVAEDLILSKMKEKERDPTVPKFKIDLMKFKTENGKAKTYRQRNRAIILYDPSNHPHDLRLFVAHELGHLLCRYWVTEGDITDNNANLLAFFAISGKNVFYTKKAPTLIYDGGDLEIISKIQAACPITKENQY